LALIGFLSLRELYVGEGSVLSLLPLFAGSAVLTVIIAIVWARRSRGAFTVLPSSAGNVLVIPDNQHDDILAELQARRTAALRRHAEIDPQADRWTELKKFKFLFDEMVITEQEFEKARQQLALEDFGLAIEPPQSALRH
jgi:hypothetical protein